MLKMLRTRSGLTQQELANAVNCTRQLISAIERGVCFPSVPQAKEFAKILNCEWTRLFEREEENNGEEEPAIEETRAAQAAPEA
jgi:transcriptional regulator with XRE-family HTH domain